MDIKEKTKPTDSKNLRGEENLHERLFVMETESKHNATKADVTQLQVDIANLKAELLKQEEASKNFATKTKLAEIKAELLKLEEASKNFATKADLLLLQSAVLRLEEASKNFATKEDLLKLKIWMITSVAGGAISTVAIGFALFRFFG